MPNTPIAVSASYRATDMNKAGGQILDMVASKGAVTITRREQEFVLILASDLAKILDDARADRPQSLDDLLRDYDRDKISRLTTGFMADTPVGKERL
ncbi:hypothetical protein [Azospirillum griseum]|uniref:Antitoxin n=1 Tax=Azospirillum griseum TaxID=2496639 RepID=A0A431VF70_9PROT|nr:hypothetical protein [Azospirillum griseum]RTR18063.1 hypothetical protein EJ903_16305 [Azospirillum griseum]